MSFRGVQQASLRDNNGEQDETQQPPLAALLSTSPVI